MSYNVGSTSSAGDKCLFRDHYGNDVCKKNILH